MAALMRNGNLNISFSVCRQLLIRHYASRMKRSIQDVHTPESDAENSRRPARIVNPKKNPFLQYDPSDPVQRGMLHVAQNRDHSKNKAYNKNFKKKNEFPKRIKDIPYAHDTQAEVYNTRTRASQGHNADNVLKPSKGSTSSSKLTFSWIDSNDPITG